MKALKSSRLALLLFVAAFLIGLPALWVKESSMLAFKMLTILSTAAFIASVVVVLKAAFSHEKIS